jgi:hypothetical protein
MHFARKYNYFGTVWAFCVFSASDFSRLLRLFVMVEISNLGVKMAQREEFPRLDEAARRLGARTDLDMVELRELLCHDCQFWHDEHEEDLECSCFQILRLLLENRTMTPTSLADALRRQRRDL